jgi:guanylate kinase
MPAGKLIVITGPSGVGKGTIVRALLESHPDLGLSISATTRQPRPGEVEGVDYYFFSRTQFEAAIASGEFLEWAEYAGNYYGTPRTQVEAQLTLGNSIVLEIEVVGAKKIASIFPAALKIFILPPSLNELEQRIRKRGTNSEESIARRMAIARCEIESSTAFDFTIINDNLERAIAEIEAIIF